jgi:hypothetical protein
MAAVGRVHGTASGLFLIRGMRPERFGYATRIRAPSCPFCLAAKGRQSPRPTRFGRQSPHHLRPPDLFPAPVQRSTVRWRPGASARRRNSGSCLSRVSLQAGPGREGTSGVSAGPRFRSSGVRQPWPQAVVHDGCGEACITKHDAAYQRRPLPRMYPSSASPKISWMGRRSWMDSIFSRSQRSSVKRSVTPGRFLDAVYVRTRPVVVTIRVRSGASG